MLASNGHPGPEQAAGVVREGSALLQGLATCGRCGRRLRVYYQGKNSTPGYYCANSQAFNGRGIWCLRVGGVRVDHAVVEVFVAIQVKTWAESVFPGREPRQGQRGGVYFPEVSTGLW